MKNSIKAITIDQLQVGMYLADMNNDWLPNQNFARKGVINSAEVIKKIFDLGVKQLYIDVSKGKAYKPSVVLPEVKPLKSLQTTVSLAKEIDNAKDIQTEATALIGQCMADVKVGKAVDSVPLADMAGGIMDSLSRNHHALACVTQMRDKDRYLMEHSFSVSVLMGILASIMGYSGDILHQMVTGALLHDIGKIRVSDKILHKPGKLTDEEWLEMKNHVTYGEEVLRKTRGITPIMLDICAQHHERLDGSGYPRGLSLDDIPIHSRMASVVDVYDAITAERVYHKGMAPTTALKKLLEWSGEDQLDRKLIHQFIKAMGIYPVGSVVELDNQKLAVVTDINPDDNNKPKVLQMYDLRTRRYDNRYTIDLSDERCGRNIVKAVYAESYGIKTSDFI